MVIRIALALIASSVIGCATVPKGHNAVAEMDEVKELVVDGQFDKAMATVKGIPVNDDELVLYLIFNNEERMVQTSFPKKIIASYLEKTIEFVNRSRKSVEDECLREPPTTKTQADVAADCLKSRSDRLPSISARGAFNQSTYGTVESCRTQPGGPECSPLGAIPGYDWQGRHYVFETAAAANLTKYFRTKVDELKSQGLELAKSAQAEHEKRLEELKAEESSPEGIRKLACRTYSVIKMAKKSIEDEREVGKVSGVVDRAKLHEAGQYILGYSRQLKGLAKKYKSMSGREWHSSMCK